MKPYLLIPILLLVAAIPVDTFLSYTPAQIWNAQDPQVAESGRDGPVYYWTFTYRTAFPEYLDNGTVQINLKRMAGRAAIAVSDWQECRDRFVRETCLNYLVRSTTPVTDPGTGKTYYSASYQARIILTRNVMRVVQYQQAVDDYLVYGGIQEGLTW